MAIFERSGIQLHYEDHGTGIPVLLIHGLGSSALDWEYQLPALTGFRVIAVDLRGHGRSTRGAVPISMELFADDLAALLDHLGAEPAHVVGLSLGGGVAFQLALDRPGLVRSLTIVNSGPHAITNPLAASLLVGSRLLIIRLFGLPKLGEKVAGRLYPKPENAAQKADFIARFRGNDVDCYQRSLKALIGWSVLHRLDEIRMPVLVLTADDDYTSVRWKKRYSKRLRDTELVIVPDSRHALPMEKPAPFNAALVEFLRRR